jgi:EAL domain-containing protein (putative c-di-GMP-specific phosphodiesterase class I)
VLESLQRLGVQLAVDDFGTGYSSLSYLADLPVNYLKIDRSFVEGAGRRPKSESILGAVIQMAHGLGLRVVAEGVESAEQLTWLAARGCDMVQGFMLGRPREAARCEHWLTPPAPPATAPAATAAPEAVLRAALQRTVGGPSAGAPGQ